MQKVASPGWWRAWRPADDKGTSAGQRNPEEGGQQSMLPPALPSRQCPSSDEGHGLSLYLDLTLTDNMLLAKLLTLSEPQCPHLKSDC